MIKSYKLKKTKQKSTFLFTCLRRHSGGAILGITAVIEEREEKKNTLMLKYPPESVQ